jgi:hypothetical protein
MSPVSLGQQGESRTHQSGDRFEAAVEERHDAPADIIG